jgi:hypothetical protein
MHLVRSKRPLCWWCGVVWRGGRWLLADARGARAAAAHLKIRSDGLIPAEFPIRAPATAIDHPSLLMSRMEGHGAHQIKR